MSTVVYHQQANLQSCFEPQIFEMSTTIKLKVPPLPRLEFGIGPKANENSKEVKDCGGWSFIQSLANIPKDTAVEKETAYVHPLARRLSSSRLSDKSLALCTEPLGSETGTDITESSIFSTLDSPEPTCRKSSPKERQEQVLPPLLPSQQVESINVAAAHKSMNSNSKNSRNNFPPPLTTISGANSLRVRPHREGGRLIIRAVETPTRHCYLQAERSHGRLRLCFFNDNDDDSVAHFDSQTTSEENDGDNEEFRDENDEFESDINGEGEAELEEVEEEEEEESDVYMARDMDGNTFEVEVEMGMNKCLLGRCKEGGHSNKGLCHWGKPLCVST